MYKKGSFLEPNKEIKFGGMKYQGGGTRREENRDVDTKTGNQRYGTTEERDYAKKNLNPYARAKKKDPKLDSYIKARNAAQKGSAEYNAAQNKINAAYGKGPTNRPTNSSRGFDGQSTTSGRPGVGRPTNQGTRRSPDVKPVTEKKGPKQIPNQRPTPTLKQPMKPKAPAAPASEGKKPKDRRVKFQSGKENRKARRATNKSRRMADRMEKKEGRIRKALGRSGKRINKLNEMREKANMMSAGGSKKKSSRT